MSTHPSVSDLEALVAGTLDEDRSILISVHSDECPQCSREVAWLRAEKELFAQRARGVPPSEVWAQVEAKIAARIGQKEQAPRGLSRILGRNFASQRAQWYAVGAAAIAIFGVVAASPLSPLRRANHGNVTVSEKLNIPNPLSAMGDLSELHDGAGEEDNNADAAEPEDTLTTQVKVSAPISLEIVTDAADVEVSQGAKDQAKLSLDESGVRAVKLIPPASGQGSWRLDFDGSTTLPNGALRLQLPEGSKVDVKTASGDVRVHDLKSDVSVVTASGDIAVKQARSLYVQSVSGDIELHDISGTVDAKTTSGELHMGGEIVSPVRFHSISGDMTLAGPCRIASCKVTAQTTSGNVTIQNDRDSSLTAKLKTKSGELLGIRELTMERKGPPRSGTEWIAKLGQGVGSIELDSMSGDLHIGTR